MSLKTFCFRIHCWLSLLMAAHPFRASKYIARISRTWLLIFAVHIVPGSYKLHQLCDYCTQLCKSTFVCDFAVLARLIVGLRFTLPAGLYPSFWSASFLPGDLYLSQSFWIKNIAVHSAHIYLCVIQFNSAQTSVSWKDRAHHWYCSNNLAPQKSVCSFHNIVNSSIVHLNPSQLL